MNIVRSIIPFVLVAAASPVLGQACVSSTFDRSVPGAQNVVSHISDVPSVQFPAFWQEGTLDMYRYRIFQTVTEWSQVRSVTLNGELRFLAPRTQKAARTRPRARRLRPLMACPRG